MEVRAFLVGTAQGVHVGDSHSVTLPQTEPTLRAPVLALAPVTLHKDVFLFACLQPGRVPYMSALG